MFDNIGGKIKSFAKTVTYLGITVSCIYGLFIMTQDDGIGIIPGLCIAFFGSLGSWIGSFLIYGFGQLVENSDILVENTKVRPCADSAQKDAPCTVTDSDATYNPLDEAKKVPVQIKVSCTTNYLFSKYDLTLKVDFLPLGVLPHGDSLSWDLSLTPGEHILYASGSASANGQISFTVSESGTFHFLADCESEQILLHQI